MCVYRADPEDDHYSQCEPVPACVQWMEEYIYVGGHLDGSRLMGILCKKGDVGQGVIVADHFRLDEHCLVTLQHIRAAVDMTCMVSFGLRQSSAVHGTKLSCISNMILTGDTCFFVSEDVSSSEVFLKHSPWQLGLFTGRLVCACVDPNSGGQKRKLSQSELDTITQNRQEAMAIRQKKMQGSLYSFHIQNLSVKVLAHAERDVCRGGVRRSFPPLVHW